MPVDNWNTDPRAVRVLAGIEQYRAKLQTVSAAEGVYLGPPWELPVLPVAGPGRGWKVAALQRISGRGAEHWGHIYILAVPQRAAGKVETTDRREGLRPVIETAEVEPVPFDDPGLLLFIRPSHAEHRLRLETLALALARELPSSEELSNR